MRRRSKAADEIKIGMIIEMIYEYEEFCGHHDELMISLKVLLAALITLFYC